MKRTIEKLRNTIKGKIYIYLDTEKTGTQFMQDAAVMLKERKGNDDADTVFNKIETEFNVPILPEE